jgi:rod shape-determining protein MreB
MSIHLRTAYRDPDIAIDLGTALTRIASGSLSQTVVPSKVEGRPVLRSGTIADPDAAVELLRPLLFRVRKFGVLRPNAVACAPSDATGEELDTLRECVVNAGAATVVIVPEILAAAIGAGMDVSSHYAGMIVDIGEGITECAVIRAGKIIEKHTRRVGCFDLRRHVLQAVSSMTKLQIPDAEAERLLRETGVAGKKGALRIFFTGCTGPAAPYGTVSISGERIHEAVEPVIASITGVVTSLLEALSPAVSCQIIDSGICLSGGGTLLRGMGHHLERLTGIPVTSPSNPLDAVVAGAWDMLPVMSIVNRHLRKLQ